MKEFGNRIRLLRNARDMSQKDLSEALSIGQSTIAHYEVGDRQPDLITIIRIARFFEVTTDSLFGLEPDRSQTPNMRLAVKLESLARENEELRRRLEQIYLLAKGDLVL